MAVDILNPDDENEETPMGGQAPAVQPEAPSQDQQESQPPQGQQNAPVQNTTTSSNTGASVGAPPVQQSKQPSVLEVAYPRLQTASQKAPQQKATGFTNLNRIMQANTGNKLGQTVSSGVTQSAQNVQSGITSAQQRFNEEAQKKRLDTQEAADKRSEVLGRFDQNTYKPDESLFKISDDLQNSYNQEKELIQQNKGTGAVISPQISTAQNNLNAANSAVSSAQANYNNSLTRVYVKGHSSRKNSDVAAALAALNAAKAAQVTSQNDLATTENRYNNEGQLADLDARFADLSNKEKSAYMDSEQKRMQSEMLPTDQEITDFTRFRTGTYTGPDELQDVSTLYGKAAQSEQMGQLARSTGGRQELLRRFVGGDDYTQGQKRLDETILGQDTSTNLGAAARQTRGAISDVEKANVGASSLAEEYKNRAKIFGQETIGKIADTKSPLDAILNKKVEDYQRIEKSNQDSVASIKDILAGNNPDYKILDKNTRLGLALTQAQMSGFLSEQEVKNLVGSGGMLQRAFNLGLDPNALLMERIQQTAAENVSRTGVASEEEIAQLNALDKLSGKQGTDLEFLQSQGKYKEGGVNVGLDSLADYIKKTEDEKARKDAKYADELERERLEYMNLMMAGGSDYLGGSLGAAGSGVGLMMDAATGAMLYNPKSVLTNTAGVISGVGQSALGAAQMNANAGNSAIEGLLRLNIGGKSIANTPGGKQLLDALQLKSKLEQEAFQMGGQVVGNYAGGFTDLASGNIAGGLAKLTGIELANNLAKSVTKNIANEVTKAAQSVSSAFNKATGYSRWCFSPDTVVELDNGSILLSDLKVGDEIFLGGKVLSIETRKVNPSEVLKYNGVHVTSEHKVLENKKMVTIAESEKKTEASKLIDTVISIVTENHVVISNDTVFADCWKGEE